MVLFLISQSNSRINFQVGLVILISDNRVVIFFYPLILCRWISHSEIVIRTMINPNLYLKPFYNFHGAFCVLAEMFHSISCKWHYYFLWHLWLLSFVWKKKSKFRTIDLFRSSLVFTWEDSDDIVSYLRKFLANSTSIFLFFFKPQEINVSFAAQPFSWDLSNRWIWCWTLFVSTLHPFISDVSLLHSFVHSWYVLALSYNNFNYV